QLGEAPKPPVFRSTTVGGWFERKVDFLVPEGAATLEIVPTLTRVRAGTLDLDDFQLVIADPEPIRAMAAKKARELALRNSLEKPKVAVPSAEQLPPMLHVEGNQIKTADGKAIWLQGLAVPSLEWTPAGENVLRSVQVGLEDWGANCIRLAVKESYWNGEDQADGGAAYKKIIDDDVNLCALHGAYLVIDLHRYRAPEQVHADFWKEVAEKYKNHPAVLFDLLNEPHDITWEIWRDGGPVKDQKKVAANRKADEPLPENDASL